jgi:hypothetical protein
MMRKSMAVALSLSLVPLLAPLTVSPLAQAQTVDSPIGKLDFELGVPTKETVTKLYDAMDFQRASQLYLWALPVVGFAQLQALQEGSAGALPGDVVIYKGYRNVLVFFTPNVTTPYPGAIWT